MTEFVSYRDFITDSDWMIHLDPGHGGMIDGEYQTKGKMFKHPEFTFYEGVFNRDMALNISSRLIKEGISHTFSTDSNIDVSLPVRCTQVNNYVKKYKKKHLFLSLHGNAAGTESANGMELFTSPGKTASDAYASVLYKSLKKMGWRMRNDFSDGDPDKEAKFYVLLHTICPAVLIEYGFYTNKEEAEKMLKPEVQDRLSELTVEGILNTIT